MLFRSCIAMGPVIASIHEKRAALRQEIMEEGQLDHAPALKPTRRLRDAKPPPLPQTDA